MPPPQIDPKTGEVIQSGVQIDPKTGEVATHAPGGDPYTAPVAGAGPGGPPVLAAHPPVAMQAPVNILGDGNGMDVAGNFGKHVATGLKGLLDTVTDKPEGAAEWGASLLGPAGTAGYRALVKPSIAPAKEAVKQAKAGNLVPHGSEYDDKGDYQPSAMSSAIDAIPMAGPWARSIENEAHTKGLLPAVAGAGGDVVAAEAPGLLGRGMRAAAPKFAEAAMRTQPMDRTFGRNDEGRTPGEALLRETTGTDPGDIARQAHEKVGDLNSELERNALNSPHMASLIPAWDAVTDYSDQALSRGNPASFKKIGQLRDHLTKQIDPATGNYSNNTPIPSDINPRYLLDLKRGVGERGKSWLARDPADLPDTATSRIYHLLDEEGDRTIPNGRELDERMSSLLPVAKRAGAVDLNASVLQKVANRLATPTGAMAPAGVGAYFGGPIGAAAGVVLPDVLTSPKTILRGARLLDNAPAPPRGTLLPAVVTNRDQK